MSTVVGGHVMLVVLPHNPLEAMEEVAAGMGSLLFLERC
jgi:hypothetical protein